MDRVMVVVLQTVHMVMVQLCQLLVLQMVVMAWIKAQMEGRLVLELCHMQVMVAQEEEQMTLLPAVEALEVLMVLV